MRVFADFAARQLDREQAAHKFRQEAVARIQSALENEQFFCVFQPIFNIAEACISGYDVTTNAKLTHPTKRKLTLHFI